MPGSIAGVLLAGGKARRMGGGDKCLRKLAGIPLLIRAIARSERQVDALAINANGDASRFAAFKLPVIADSIADHAGPLAGVLAGMDWAATLHTRPSHIASFATDAPFFPADMVARLAAAIADGAEIACAASGGRAQPVFALWPVALAEELRRAMLDEDIRKVDIWTARYRLAEVAFEADGHDPFFNANRPDDLARAEDILARIG
jgi:molybdenum cofactor guanylyltransferase